MLNVITPNVILLEIIMASTRVLGVAALAPNLPTPLPLRTFGLKTQDLGSHPFYILGYTLPDPLIH
jgi:hypothetical protein